MTVLIFPTMSDKRPQSVGCGDDMDSISLKLQIPCCHDRSVEFIVPKSAFPNDRGTLQRYEGVYNISNAMNTFILPKYSALPQDVPPYMTVLVSPAALRQDRNTAGDNRGTLLISLKLRFPRRRERPIELHIVPETQEDAESHEGAGSEDRLPTYVESTPRLGCWARDVKVSEDY